MNFQLTPRPRRARRAGFGAGGNVIVPCAKFTIVLTNPASYAKNPVMPPGFIIESSFGGNGQWSATGVFAGSAPAGVPTIYDDPAAQSAWTLTSFSSTPQPGTYWNGQTCVSIAPLQWPTPPPTLPIATEHYTPPVNAGAPGDHAAPSGVSTGAVVAVGAASAGVLGTIAYFLLRRTPRRKR